MFKADLRPFGEVDVVKRIAAGRADLGDWALERAANVELLNLQRTADERQVGHLADRLGVPTWQVYLLDAHRGIDNLGLATVDGMPSIANAQSLRDARSAIADLVNNPKVAARDDVAIVFGDEHMYAFSPLLAELRNRGVRNVRMLKASDLEVRRGKLYHTVGGAQQQIAMPQAVIARGVGGKQGTGVLRRLEDAGVHMANRGVSRRNANKLPMTRAFLEHGIAHPKTVLDVTSNEQMREAAKVVGYPVVLKRTSGAGGEWVFKADNPAELERELAAIDGRLAQKLGHDSKGRGIAGDRTSWLAQEFIPEANGTDYRVFIVRGVDGTNRAVSAYRRAAPDDGFKAVGLGATVHHIPLRGHAESLGEPDLELAARAADAMGADVAGIDLIMTSDGMKVIEGNAVPGIPEIDMPVAYGEHALPKIADWLAFGSRDAATGAAATSATRQPAWKRWLDSVFDHR